MSDAVRRAAEVRDRESLSAAVCRGWVADLHAAAEQEVAAAVNRRYSILTNARPGDPTLRAVDPAKLAALCRLD